MVWITAVWLLIMLVSEVVWLLISLSVAMSVVRVRLSASQILAIKVPKLVRERLV